MIRVKSTLHHNKFTYFDYVFLLLSYCRILSIFTFIYIYIIVSIIKKRTYNHLKMNTLTFYKIPDYIYIRGEIKKSNAFFFNIGIITNTRICILLQNEAGSLLITSLLLNIVNVSLTAMLHLRMRVYIPAS